MSDCRKCARFEECAADEDCGLFVDKPMTNADRIRAMSDEELAEYLIADIEAEAIRRAGRYLTSGEINRAIADCLSWLKAQAEECNGREVH